MRPGRVGFQPSSSWVKVLEEGMSAPSRGASGAPKSSAGTDLAGRFSYRPMALAISRTATPSSPTAPQPREGRLTAPEFLVILLTMTVLPLGDVKSHLSELVGRVHDHHERVTVTVHGRPSAILIAPEDLEALEETLEIMRDAATMNRLAESDAELARGEYVSAEELAEAMRQRQAQ